MTNFFRYAWRPQGQAESKFVKLTIQPEVDFCPFRGRDAPFSAGGRMHDRTDRKQPQRRLRPGTNQVLSVRVPEGLLHTESVLRQQFIRCSIVT